MGMLHTMQSSYQAARSDFIESDDAALSSYKASDRPSDCFEAGPEVGGVAVIFIGEGSDGETFSWQMWCYRAVAESGVGPAEFICSGTGILGTAVAEEGDLYCDTISITDQGSFLDIPVAIDSGNNRVCKVCFDFCGFKYLYVRITDVGGAGEATGIKPYVAFF